MEFNGVTIEFPSGDVGEDWLSSYIKDLHSILASNKKETEDSMCWVLLQVLGDAYAEGVGKESWEVIDELIPGWEDE